MRLKKVINNTYIVKKTNEEAIRTILKQNGRVTIALLSKLTGLSVATCGNILNELLSNNEVIETELENSTGGRRARQFQLNANYKQVAGLAVSNEGGIHSIDVVVANWIGDPLHSETLYYEEITYSVIEGLVGKLVKEFPNIQGVGIGIPGVVSHGVIGICDIKNLINIPIKDRIEASHSIKVNVENEIHYALSGFYKKQNYKEPKTIAMLAFIKDNPPGARFIVNGHPLKGATNFAGEISFLPLEGSWNEQLEKLYNPDTSISVVVKMIASTISIMNPEAIVLIGGLSNKMSIDEIYERCSELIPKEHMPKLFLLENVREYYRNGLITLTLETLQFNIKLIERGQNL